MGDVSSISKGPLDFLQCTENGDVVVDGHGHRIPFDQYFPPTITIEDLPDNSPATDIFADIFAWVDESPNLLTRFERSVAATLSLPFALPACGGGFISDADTDRDDDNFSFCNEGDEIDECDCNDNNENINPDAIEVCDEIDNNCDGSIDEGATNIYHLDADGDGYGDPANLSDPACSAPEGYVDNGEDCDDLDLSLNPETFWYEDFDGDTYGNVDVWQQQCSQPEGYVANAEDCDDDNALINPETVWHPDADGDGWGSDESTITICNPKDASYILAGGDCNDTDPALNPANPDGCGVPIPTFPPDGATLPNTRAYLSWDDTPWTGKTVQEYRVSYTNLSSGDSLTTSVGQTLNTAAVIDPLAENEDYTWQVKALYTDGTESALSSAYIFATDASVVGWWKFDDGTAGDSSGNSYDGTLVNDATTLSGGIDGALSLDGTNDYVDLSSYAVPLGFNSTDDYTIEARFQPDIVPSGNSYSSIFAANDFAGAAPGYTIAMTNSMLYAEIYDVRGGPGALIDIITNVTAGQFYHAAMAYSGGALFDSMSLTVNGSLRGSGLSSFNFSAGEAEYVTIGAALNIALANPSNDFTGLIDEVAIYDAALSEEEILNSYCAIETLTLGATDMLPPVCP